MKAKCILCLFLLIFIKYETEAQSLYPFNSENWVVKDKNGEKIVIETSSYKDKHCFHLPLGYVAYFQPLNPLNFTMEFDMASLTIAGVGFRGQDSANYEYLYVRIMSDSKNDAIQYLPVFNNGFSWKLYNYPKYEGISKFSKDLLFTIDNCFRNDLNSGKKLSDSLNTVLKEKHLSFSKQAYIEKISDNQWRIVDPGKVEIFYFISKESSIDVYDAYSWNHIKLKVLNNQAYFYINDMKTPKIGIKDLKGAVMPGTISLRNFFTDCYFANVTIKEENEISAKINYNEKLPQEYITSWKMSSKFQLKENFRIELLDSLNSSQDSWKNIYSDSEGLLNISRFFEETQGSVILKKTIKSDFAQDIDLFFDFADSLSIFLNSELIFSKKCEGLVVDGKESVNLNLAKGYNEIIFLLSADEYKQNWGIIAKLEQSDGLTFIN